MIRPHAPTVHLATPPGWLRRCAACGEPDIHAIVPDPALFRRSWRCGGCGAGHAVAVRVADVCPARTGMVI